MLQKIKNIYHLLNGIAANVCYMFPSRKLVVIGVTGTDGKTTTASLIYHILKNAGEKVSMISSVGAMINGREYSLPFHVTTPSRFALQKFISMAGNKNNLRNGKRYLVLEVTSHSLDQYRVFGINFEIGVITNVSHEHLDYHKNYKEYVKTKLKLLLRSKIAVVNRDDKSYRIIQPSLKNITGKISRVVTYGFNKSADVNLSSFKFESKILGDFNKYNILAAYTVANLLGVKESIIKKAIASFEPPIGRQDMVFDEDFKVMIDFAHTPNSFKEVLSAVRPNVKGKLIHVFGSAGERDRTKRPEMGKISSMFSDILLITAEDPRSENIDKINADILSGVRDRDQKLSDGAVILIEDRQQAINKAVELAKQNDMVIITGKAHEKSMNYGKGEVPWDDYKAVKKALSLKDEKN
ncbi:MAG: UDP-N-acetylmuramoyl-L-alanyl-D-glutamate--2,6-diaminopimelate ligase [Patescibacteria group bacterium]